MRDPVATKQQIAGQPQAYEFYAALRLLECAHPDKPRIGASSRPADDVVRFAQEASQAFAPSALTQWQANEAGPAERLVISFFGLLGPNGPLPGHITEHVRDRSRNHGDHATGRFLDIFHHRMIALMYRAWATAQPTVSLDRPESSRFATYVASLAGLGMAGLRHRDEVPDLAKLHFAGLMSSHARNAAGLRNIVREYFGVPAVVQQFVGHWIDLPQDERCELCSGHRAQMLGVDTVIGTRVFSAQGKFRIVLGPLDRNQYLGFLPGQARLGRLIAWVRNYIGDALDWDVRLILKKTDVPALALNGSCRLGQTSWLLGARPSNDADDLVFSPNRRI